MSAGRYVYGTSVYSVLHQGRTLLTILVLVLSGVSTAPDTLQVQPADYGYRQRRSRWRSSATETGFAYCGGTGAGFETLRPNSLPGPLV